MAQQWELLQELQMLDVQLKDLREAKDRIETGTLRELWNKVAQLSGEVRAKAEKQAILHKQSRSIELDLAAALEHRKSLEQRLYGGGGLAPREMEQVRVKTETAEAEYERLENQLLALMEQQEENDTVLAGTSQALEDAREQHRRLQTEIARQLERLDGEISGKEQRRGEILRSIDVRLLREFNQIRYKMATPVVHMENGACGFCKMTASGPMLGQSGMFRCEHCGRLLFQ